MEPPRSLKYGALAGLGAWMIMTLVMIVLRFLLNTVSLPEVAAEWSIEVTPAWAFSLLLGVLGPMPSHSFSAPFCWPKLSWVARSV